MCVRVSVFLVLSSVQTTFSVQVVFNISGSRFVTSGARHEMEIRKEAGAGAIGAVRASIAGAVFENSEPTARQLGIG